MHENGILFIPVNCTPAQGLLGSITDYSMSKKKMHLALVVISLEV